MVSKRISMISVLFSCLLLLVVAVVFYRLPYVSITSDRLVFTPLEISLDTLDFAGERVETDPLHNPLGRDKLERELLVTHFSLYQFLLYHRLSGRYFPYMTSFFREVGVPDDFKYLAVAESGLDVTAESRVGARGLWQLMPETAKRYGLIVNDQIDERYDFEKSTRVAAKHILVLYKLFDNNWTLAAAAYNRGENGLQRDIESQPGAKGYYDLILNNETSNYLYRIVAIKYLMQNRWRLFSDSMLGQVFDTPFTKKITLQGPILDLRKWCLEHDIEYQELRELNPWILGYSLPDGPWDVQLFIR